MKILTEDCCFDGFTKIKRLFRAFLLPHNAGIQFRIILICTHHVKFVTYGNIKDKKDQGYREGNKVHERENGILFRS